MKDSRPEERKGRGRRPARGENRTGCGLRPGFSPGMPPPGRAALARQQAGTEVALGGCRPCRRKRCRIIGSTAAGKRGWVTLSGRFFSCIWYRRVLEFGYSTCGTAAFGSLRQVFAAGAVIIYVSANGCVRAVLRKARKCLQSKGLVACCPRSLSALGMEAYALLGVITRRHTWEMRGCRWPDRSTLAEKVPAGEWLAWFFLPESGVTGLFTYGKVFFREMIGPLSAKEGLVRCERWFKQVSEHPSRCRRRALTERRWQSRREQSVGKSMNQL